MKITRRKAIVTFGSGSVGLAVLISLARRFNMSSSHNPERLPVLFLGHGSPMNAITDNGPTRLMQRLGEMLPRPKAILVISAHWMTKGTWLTHMPHPKTIHDFYGFPKELFDMQYPASGSPRLAEQVQQLVTHPSLQLDSSEWGLDHGTWSVLTHLYPKAEIPVIQLSLDMSQPPQFHFDLGRQLRSLRDQGVLILGSGNIVHNLRQINWDEKAKPFEWAVEFDEWIKAKAEKRDFAPLVREATSTQAGKLSIPTPDHYLPLLYILGSAHENESLTFDIEGFQNSSISMRSLRFG